jgi:hypothetical protein
MKKSELIKIIKEEIKSVILEQEYSHSDIMSKLRQKTDGPARKMLPGLDTKKLARTEPEKQPDTNTKPPQSSGKPQIVSFPGTNIPAIKLSKNALSARHEASAIGEWFKEQIRNKGYKNSKFSKAEDGTIYLVATK